VTWWRKRLANPAAGRPFEASLGRREEQATRGTIDEAGAIATFEGLVRNHNDGRSVLFLEYESYDALALKEGNAIVKQAFHRFDLIDAICVHRVGRLKVGEAAVWVGTAAAHRREAFEACQFIIDQVKHRVPIWKKEFYSDGETTWVRRTWRSRMEALIPLFFLVALLYSMGGFGGGSSYLALLVLFAVPLPVIPIVALLCNIIVVSNGSFQFVRAGHFSWKLLVPFAVTSIPFAYLGGRIHVSKTLFLVLLSLSLLCAGLNMLFVRRSEGDSEPCAPAAWKWGLPWGALLGGVSGLVGIGGGIFLSPLLHMFRWGNSKQIAATASLFILLNSVAGLAGQLSKPVDPALILEYLWLPAAALAGGMLGSFLATRRISHLAVQRVTAVLVLYAAVRVGVSAL
jgi:molybdopterin synthase catalytic subunit/uncharacterized membrane protein YfcA